MKKVAMARLCRRGLAMRPSNRFSRKTIDKMEHFVELPMRLHQYSSFGVGS